MYRKDGKDFHPSWTFLSFIDIFRICIWWFFLKRARISFQKMLILSLWPSFFHLWSTHLASFLQINFIWNYVIKERNTNMYCIQKSMFFTPKMLTNKKSWFAVFFMMSKKSVKRKRSVCFYYIHASCRKRKLM